MNYENHFPISINVDVQNTFMPGGELPVKAGHEVVEPLNQVNKIVRNLGGLAIFTRDYHPVDTNKHFETWGPHGIAGTYGAEFHKDLIIKNTDIIISKGMDPSEDAYSGFQGTDSSGQTIEDIITKELKVHKAVVLAIGGLATDYCDLQTVLSALDLKRTFKQDQLTVVALTDCMRAVNISPNDELVALEKMKQAGAQLMSGDEFIENISRKQRF